MTTPELLRGPAWTALPLPPDPSSGRAFVVTSHHGPRDGGTHGGIDLATRNAAGRPTTGIPVFAPTAGVVTRIVSAKRGGLVLVLELPDGGELKLMHLRDTVAKVGEIVLPGDLVAHSGDTGGVPPHLHLEVWFHGENLDPLPYLEEAAANARRPQDPEALNPILLGGSIVAGLLLLLLGGFKK